MSTDAISSSTSRSTVGFYGKLPARGDFVQRNLPRSFIDRWDDWLQAAMTSSRDQLGEQWLRSYLTSPVWRFALSAGVCGEQPLTGLLIPSVDRVGRYFPLCIVALLPDSIELLDILEQRDWFDQAETVILSGLDDNLDFARFTDQVEELQFPPLPECTAVPVAADHQQWYCAVPDFTALPELRKALTPVLLRHVFADYSLWWTQGSEHVDSCILLSRGLPAVDAFAALLAGRWEHWGWSSLALFGGAADELPEEL